MQDKADTTTSNEYALLVGSRFSFVQQTGVAQ